MAHCFVTRKLPGKALERLGRQHSVTIWPHKLPPTAEELQKQVAGADALITMLSDHIDQELIETNPQLKAIANYAVGYNNIDLVAADRNNIAVGNTPDVLTEATADLTFALILSAARKLYPAEQNARSGAWKTWDPTGFLGHDVHAATLGIIGNGRIGKAVAKRAEGFSMRILHSSRSSGMPLKELLPQVDYLTLHCPLTEQTRHLIGAAELKQMKPTAVIINTARGEIIDQQALIEALHNGQIAAAALDVTDPEPPTENDPLLSAPNLTLLPHIGSATTNTREKMAEIAVNNIIAALNNEPMPHPVNHIKTG